MLTWCDIWTVVVYDRHVNANDPGTCILKITLSNAVVFSKDTKYIIDHKNAIATAIPFIIDIF
jgi:hypothetical protein